MLASSLLKGTPYTVVITTITRIKQRKGVKLVRTAVKGTYNKQVNNDNNNSSSSDIDQDALSSRQD